MVLGPVLQELERALKECQQRLAKAEKDLAASQERKGQLEVRVGMAGVPMACTHALVFCRTAAQVSGFRFYAW